MNDFSPAMAATIGAAYRNRLTGKLWTVESIRPDDEDYFVLTHNDLSIRYDPDTFYEDFEWVSTATRPAS